MTTNERTVHDYMEGFRRADHARVLACLTDDVEWVVPGMFQARGQQDFENHIVDEGFRPNPDIVITRVIESGDVLVAEGRVRTERTDGAVVNLLFCDVFEMRDGRIAKLTSYLMMQP
jgi:ketosteroid isomerase-like protein